MRKKILFGVLVGCLCLSSVAFVRGTEDEVAQDSTKSEFVEDEAKQEIKEEIADEVKETEAPAKKKASKKKKTEEVVEEKSEEKTEVPEKKVAVGTGVASKKIELAVENEGALARLATIMGSGKEYTVKFAGAVKLEDGTYIVNMVSDDKYRNGTWEVDVYNCAADNYRLLPGYESWCSLYDGSRKAIGIAQAKKVKG